MYFIIKFQSFILEFTLSFKYYSNHFKVIFRSLNLFELKNYTSSITIVIKYFITELLIIFIKFLILRYKLSLVAFLLTFHFILKKVKIFIFYFQFIFFTVKLGSNAYTLRFNFFFYLTTTTFL